MKINSPKKNSYFPRALPNRNMIFLGVKIFIFPNIQACNQSFIILNIICLHKIRRFLIIFLIVESNNVVIVWLFCNHIFESYIVNLVFWLYKENLIYQIFMILSYLSTSWFFHEFGMKMPRFLKRWDKIFIFRETWHFVCPVTWLSRPIRLRVI